MNSGSCLCGDISWEIAEAPFMMSNCHCSMCRKSHGSAYGTYVGVASDDFRWTSGEDRIQYYESSPGGLRPFCGRCGSIVAGPTRDGNSVFMPAGNMEGALDCSLDSHIFAASKAPWFEITDSAPQFDAYPDGIDAPSVDNPERPPATAGAIGGSCLCHQIAFEFDGPVERMGYCHCSRCRKSRSAAHSAQTFAAIESFRWVRGEALVRTFKLPGSDDYRNAFCSTCASKMPTLHPGMEAVLIPAGALDQDPGIRPQAHIYTASKAPWFEITDDLPQFAEMPDG